MHLDIINQPIKVGDTVCFIVNSEYSSYLKTGVVTKLSPVKVHVSGNLVYPKKVIVINEQLEAAKGKFPELFI